jgi:hypothetical protein
MVQLWGTFTQSPNHSIFYYCLVMKAQYFFKIIIMHMQGQVHTEEVTEQHSSKEEFMKVRCICI